MEFEDFTVEEELHITINLKDFKVCYPTIAATCQLTIVGNLQAIIYHADSLGATISGYYSDPGRPLQVQYDRDGMICEFTLMTTGSGGKNPPQFTRVIARTVPSPASNRQAMSATNQRPPSRNVSENRDEDLMKGPERHNATQLRSPGLEVPNEMMENVQPVTSEAEAELSLFFDIDESMDDGRPEESDDVLGWDVDMDHSVSVTVGFLLDCRCLQGMERRTGPTITQSGQGQRQHLFRDEDDSDDAAEDDMIIGPTQHVSQVSVELLAM